MIRTSELEPLLEHYYAGFDFAAHVGRDPLKFLHRHEAPEDVEVTGLIAASLAFGRVRSFCAVLEELLGALGDRPAAALREGAPALLDAASSRGYRWLEPRDLRALLVATGATLREHGSLEAAFASHDDGGDDVWHALGGFLTELKARAVQAHEDAEARARALAFLFPSVQGTAACKRQNLFLRWMVRTADEGADRGLWTGVSPSRLIMPCDVHTSRIGHALGLTEQAEPCRKTADQLTGNLRLIDPLDPVRFDFALAHLGISGGCQARPISSICNTCGLQTACRWWGTR